ncbi:polymorphic toxin-type HINT domain-containing protein [Micromonospora tulbaghiae]|uniref:polymorphic toxin-type HINT domain-containing protein n=1 Tax=Micromonospora tulbaghiae TaxID=479978 RepID=UPI0033E4601E
MKDLRVGDIVAATDPETGESGAEGITNLWIHEDELRLLSLDGGSVATTNDHPFWNAGDREWQPAEELDAGDALLTHDGRQLVIRRIGADSRSQAAYNLTVANLHTYYVLVGDTPVLVHNTCPKGAKRGPKPAGTGPHNLKIEAVAGLLSMERSSRAVVCCRNELSQRLGVSRGLDALTSLYVVKTAQSTASTWGRRLRMVRQSSAKRRPSLTLRARESRCTSWLTIEAL